MAAMNTMTEGADGGSRLTPEQQAAGRDAELTEAQERELWATMRRLQRDAAESRRTITSTELAEGAANELRLHCDDEEATIPEEIFELAAEMLEVP